MNSWPKERLDLPRLAAEVAAEEAAAVVLPEVTLAVLPKKKSRKRKKKPIWVEVWTCSEEAREVAVTTKQINRPTDQPTTPIC
mmetsp:Transcript_23942/g.68144  ORF Transcript_23942/g.68144 Transcript_23942/m.68144 type:complete len:83 (+) Transcript_23942:246-494(+)